jgi:transcription elongation factor
MSIQAVIGMQNNAENASGGNDQGAPTPSSSAGGQTAAGAARPGMASGGSTPPPSGSASAGDNSAAAGGTANSGMPAINGQTTGVIGISNLNLQSSNGNQGSVLTSDKNNVKLESGTMLLLKVNQ